MAINFDPFGDTGGSGGSGGGSVSPVGQGWYVDPVANTITFLLAPGVGVAVEVKEFDTPSVNTTDVWAIGAWNGEFGYPGEIEFDGDRLVFANTPAQPHAIWNSEAGNYTQFAPNTPIVDSDTFSNTLNSRELNEIVDLVPLKSMLVMTTGAEWKMQGSEGGVMTPATASYKVESHNGSSSLPALLVGSTALYAQRLGFAIYDMTYDFAEDGFTGGDLSAFSGHLLDGYSILDWAWQSVPYSAAWMVRDDGWMLTMTYKREHQVVGFCRQQTLGEYESVCAIPAPTHRGHAVYAVVKRIVNGVTKRYIERQFIRTGTTPIIDYVGLDCALTYDGRNDTATTVTLSGGTAWDHTEIFTATASAPIFVMGVTDVDDQIVYDVTGARPIRLEVQSVTSTTVAQVRPIAGVVPVEYRSARADWAWARGTLSGLEHLAGMTVGILRDGSEETQQVMPLDGILTLPVPGAVVHVGLPYNCDMETLDVTLIGQEDVASRRKIIKKVDVKVKASRDVSAGPDFDHLRTAAPRWEEVMGQVPVLRTGILEIDVSGKWGTSGRVCIRHSSPLPLTIVGVTPEVAFGT